MAAFATCAALGFEAGHAAAKASQTVASSAAADASFSRQETFADNPPGPLESLGEALGRGTFGQVFASCLNGKVVAVKVASTRSPFGLVETQRQLWVEYRHAASLERPMLPKLLGWVSLESGPGTVWEFVDGKTLNNELISRSQIDYAAVARDLHGVQLRVFPRLPPLGLSQP